MIKTLAILSLAASSVAFSQGKEGEWAADYSEAQGIFEYIEYMKAAHPTATLEELDTLVKEDFGTRSTAESEDGSDLDYSGVVNEVLPPGAQLNAAERALFNDSPWKGLLVINAGRLARDSSLELYAEGLYNGNGDAYRHCYWNNLMVKETNQEFAKAWGNAHEDDPDNPPLEKWMDISNNNDGRRLAQNHRSDSDKERSSRCLDGVVTRRLVRIVDGKIVPTDGTGRR